MKESNINHIKKTTLGFAIVALAIILAIVSVVCCSNNKSSIYLVIRMQEASEKTYRYIIDNTGTMTVEIGNSHNPNITAPDFLDNNSPFETSIYTITLTTEEQSLLYALADEIESQGSYQSDKIVDDSIEVMLSYNDIDIHQYLSIDLSPAVRSYVSEILRLYPMDFGSSDVILTSTLGLHKK